MPKLFAEATGTFMLVAAICGATVISFDAMGGGSGSAGIMVPLAIGLSFAALHLISMPITNTPLNSARSMPRRCSPNHRWCNNSGCFGRRRLLAASSVELPTGQSVM